MTKTYLNNIIKLLSSLNTIHEKIETEINHTNYEPCLHLLEECQEYAISMGNTIEASEGENTSVIPHLENYCESVFQLYQAISSGGLFDVAGLINDLNQKLRVSIDCVKTTITPRKEVVFLPYKAAMWDSLESIWRAFDEDPDCDAFVIPIPYYDKNPDGTLGKMYYERSLFPEEIPTMDYASYDFDLRHPDAIFIHNPYDDCNYVTTVHPSFYSRDLKQYTDTLVYVPYYVVSGEINDFGKHNPVNHYADYIIMQSRRDRNGYPEQLPDSKFLPLGSPKLDKVIRLCQNKPPVPAEWASFMKGKKVYFYNTSIGGMLSNTRNFILKMEYVFRTFKDREDACLIWRPHPLMESTFDSLRANYKPFYDSLKNAFFSEQIGILDTTPDIEKTIALCDAYIGDASTSVISLFGIANKPIFALDNRIHRLPAETDITLSKANYLSFQSDSDWLVTNQNQLYHRDCNKHYHYVTHLSEYASGSYYLRAITIGNKTYICPRNAMNIPVIDREGHITKNLALTNHVCESGRFGNAIQAGKYIFLIPVNYPAIVRIDTEDDTLSYVEGLNELFVDMPDNLKSCGDACIWKEYLLITNPVKNQVLAIHIKDLTYELIAVDAPGTSGFITIKSYPDIVYLMPTTGFAICAWNPDTGFVKEYPEMPEGFGCINLYHGYACNTRPFARPLSYHNKLYLPPYWGNMFVEIDLETGKSTALDYVSSIVLEDKNDYFAAEQLGDFVPSMSDEENGIFVFCSNVERCYYEINVTMQTCKRIEISFDSGEVMAHEPGFNRLSQWFLYGCEENACNTLSDFLSDTLPGKPFDPDAQAIAFQDMAENSDGSCGQKVYEFIKEHRFV